MRPPDAITYEEARRALQTIKEYVAYGFSDHSVQAAANVLRTYSQQQPQREDEVKAEMRRLKAAGVKTIEPELPRLLRMLRGEA